MCNGQANGFSSDFIAIEIKSPDCPGLTLIDLPGIIWQFHHAGGFQHAGGGTILLSLTVTRLSYQVSRLQHAGGFQHAGGDIISLLRIRIYLVPGKFTKECRSQHSTLNHGYGDFIAACTSLILNTRYVRRYHILRPALKAQHRSAEPRPLSCSEEEGRTHSSFVDSKRCNLYESKT